MSPLLTRIESIPEILPPLHSKNINDILLDHTVKELYNKVIHISSRQLYRACSKGMDLKLLSENKYASIN